MTDWSVMPSYRGKRALDLAIVLLASPIWVPVLLVVAVAVRLRLGSPVFFRQARAGLNDRSFQLLKFRTMTNERGPDGQLLPDAKRLTPFGRWLRSTSLDELPELLNVLRGDMSVTGPRPLLVQYVPLYSPTHRRRHEVRPGVTGLAQVSGRNALTWPERFDLDVWYVDHASLSLDMSILARTVGALLGRKGISAPGEATMSYFTGYSSPERPQSTSGTPRSPDPGLTPED
jgi:lipopolysaccharide/colanic/teichoic acid biosynthesis glycosyltransferase